MAQKKKKPKLKRENGKGSVYKISDNRRNPWAVAVSLNTKDEGIGDRIKKPNQKILCTIDDEDKGISVLQRYNELSEKLLQRGVAEEKMFDTISGIIKRTKHDWEELNNELTLVNLSSLLMLSQQFIIKPVTKDSTIEEIAKIVIDEAEKDKKAKSTVDGWKASYKAIISLKDESLFYLDYRAFQVIIDDLINDPNKKASYGKLKKIIAFISKMYVELIKNKVTQVNYSQFISLRDVTEDKVPPFPDKDIETLFNNDEDRIAKSSLIMAYTGYRIEEFLTIDKDRINLDKWYITGGNKTEAGKNKVVVIHSKIRKYVEYFYNEFPNCKYLFSRNGEKVLPNYYRRKYHYPMVERFGLSDLGTHSLKHYAASQMRMAGVDDKAMTEMLGHVDPKFTDERYVDVNIEYLHKQIEKVK